MGDPERVRLLRPATLAGVEALHATFVAHRYAPHIHDSLTVGYVDRGAITFELEAQRHLVPAGSAFLIPPQLVHTGESVKPSGYTYRVLYLDPDQLAARSDGAIAPTALRRVPIVLRRQGLAVALKRMHATLAPDGSPLERGEALGWVALALERLLAGGRSHQRRPVHPAVRRAREYIHEHWRRDFTLDELSTAVAISPFHLARMFRTQIGVPPSSYRRALRIRAAQRLLRAGEAPAAIAVECGFYDQAHLNRQFKRATGLTPGQYAMAD